MKTWLNTLMLVAVAGGVMFCMNQTAEAQYIVRPAYVGPYYGPVVTYRRPLLGPRRVVAYPVAPVVVGYPSATVVAPTVVNYAPAYPSAVVNYAPAYSPTVVNYPSTISAPTVVGYPGTTVYYNRAPSPAVVYPLPSVVYPPAVFP